MRYVVYIILLLAAVFTGVAVRQFVLIKDAVAKLPYDNKPFVRMIPDAPLKFLFTGDSTALGTGALSNTQSVAGWFAKDYPQASIENVSANGKTTAQLLEEFHPEGQYDLIVLQIGGNDILKLTSLIKTEKNITQLIHRAKAHAKHVVIMHSGNVGLAPVFIWPVDEIMTMRARNVRAMYMTKAQEEGVYYIDLFTERHNDLFLKNVAEYYSPDHLHPSGSGYRWWYTRIRETLYLNGVKL